MKTQADMASTRARDAFNVAISSWRKAKREFESFEKDAKAEQSARDAEEREREEVSH